MPKTETGSFRTPRLEHARVADAMHAGVVTCPPETSMRDVARMMATHHVHCVVISEVPQAGEAPTWGIVSDLDLVAAMANGSLREVTAGACAATEPLTISADASLSHAAQLMAERQVAHLIVLTPASGRPAGVLSTLDLAGVAGWGDT